jgi:hypothetical protein
MKNNTAKALPIRLLGFWLTMSLTGLVIIALLIQLSR